MSIITIISDALQSLPPKARKGLYAAYALVVIAAGAAAIADIDTGKLNDVLLYVGGFLGVTAASNVATTPQDVVDQLDDVEPDEPDDPPLPFEQSSLAQKKSPYMDGSW